MKIVLVAEESAGINVLRALARTEHQVTAALTTEPTRGGGATLASAAEALEIPVLPSTRVRDSSLGDWLREEETDLLLNVHSLYVVHPDVVEAPRIGSFNLHPGPLPEYAGLNAPSWALFHGRTHHAVTVHWMAAGIDTGPIAYATTFELSERDTGLTVAARCSREGVPLLVRLVEDAAVDPASIPRVPQDLSRRRYYGREVPNEGRVVWEWSARQIVDFVRACDYAPFPSPWGHPRARLRGSELLLLKAARVGRSTNAEPGTVEAIEDGVARVASGDEWIALERIRVGEEAVDAVAVLSPGDVLENG